MIKVDCGIFACVLQSQFGGKRRMRVILKNNLYEMNRKQFRGVLNIAKKSVKMGIYAVEKNGIAEMKNETFDNKEDLEKYVAEYERNGFKVYYNL